MFEHIVQMGPMLVLVGFIGGWVAEAASRAGGYGFIFDMVWMPAMLVIGCAGAALAIAAQRRLWRSALLAARGGATNP